MKRLFSLILAVCLCLGTGLGLAEGTVQAKGIAGPYQWLNYELTVDAVKVAPGGELFSGPMRASRFIKQDNRIVTQIKETMVEIRLLGGEGGVAYADLEQEKIEQFVLKDASGEVIPLYCWSWWGVGYSDEKGFFTEESQEGFSLMYFLPDGVNAEDLVLSVEAGTAE